MKEVEKAEKEAIEKIKMGQIQNFEYIVKKYTKPLYAFVLPALFDKNEAEDIVQNSFLKFYKSIHRFDTNRPILPYLFEIAKNELKMYFRSKKPTVPLDETVAISDTLESVELPEGLSVDQKRALTLFAEGYSYEEIAVKLNKPLNTVRTIIRRGRQKLVKFNYS